MYWHKVHHLLGMELASQVQILDKAICLSHCVNALKKNEF